jgi:hypothetical protein
MEIGCVAWRLVLMVREAWRDPSLCILSAGRSAIRVRSLLGIALSQMMAIDTWRTSQ